MSLDRQLNRASQFSEDIMENGDITTPQIEIKANKLTLYESGLLGVAFNFSLGTNNAIYKGLSGIVRMCVLTECAKIGICHPSHCWQ